MRANRTHRYVQDLFLREGQYYPLVYIVGVSRDPHSLSLSLALSHSLSHSLSLTHSLCVYIYVHINPDIHRWCILRLPQSVSLALSFCLSRSLTHSLTVCVYVRTCKSLHYLLVYIATPTVCPAEMHSGSSK
jgi:hypothetical protein